MDKKQLRILITDDDDNDRNLIKRAINQSDLICDFSEAISVEQALHACETQPFDCIIIDYKLPGEDGLSGISALHERFPYMAIIMSTGHGNEMIAIEAMKRGASDYIVKNKLEPKLLSKTILDAIEKSSQEELLNNQKTELEFLASHDFLTKLPTRMLYESAALGALTHAKRYKKIVGIMLVDLDGFKTINDTLGHEFGDMLLQQVAKRFQSTIREEDMVARLGGDEFGILIREMDKIDYAGVIAEKLIHSLKESFLLRGEIAYITSSIGIAAFPFAGDSVSELMRNADIAMYQAKNEGKNNFQFYTCK